MEQNKGRLNYITTGIMIAILLLVLFCIREMSVVRGGIAKKDLMEAQQLVCEEQSERFRKSSDYLTEQSRLFLFTGQRKHLDGYWNEAESEKNREKATRELKNLLLTEEENALITDVKERSDFLMEKEAWAMKMMSEAGGISPSQTPVPLQKTSLSMEEQAMSSEEKKVAARTYMLSDEYLEKKQEIYTGLEEFMTGTRSRKLSELAALNEDISRRLSLVQLSNLLMLLLVLVLSSIFYFYVIRPFIRYSRELRKLGSEPGQILEPTGYSVMRSFARNFNDLYSSLLIEQKKLRKLNSIDGLTGIANRTSLDLYVQKVAEAGEKSIGLLMMDADNFKSFNDGFGHLVGDQVLIGIGSCLREIAESEGGIAGRLGGEEFAVIIPGADVEQVDRIAAVILDSVMSIDTQKLGIEVEGVRITVSIGSTICLKNKKGDLTALIRKADLALYQAKGRGKNQHVMYSEEDALFMRMEDEKMRRIEVETEMYRALEREEFIPFFQPKYDMFTGRVCGAEALVRWDHQKKGFLYPDYFVPVLEKDGFITRIDFAMFEKICSCIKEWGQEGLPLVPVACNFSRLNFGKMTLVPELVRITEKYGVSPSLIQVELTENGLLEKEAAEKMEEELRELHKAGFSIAIDDFGMGYSSLGMLHELSVDVLKVDKSFVKRDLKLRANELLLNGIRYIADIMKMDTVVEGVETEEQVEILKNMGYRVAQGFYFSRPVKKEDFEKIMRSQGGINNEEG